MNDNFLKELLPTLGLIIISVLSMILNYLQFKSHRKDKYLLSLVIERLSTYQQAYNYVRGLSKYIYKENEDNYEYIKTVEDWFFSNNLYLKPEIRKDIQEAIQICSSYHLIWQEWQSAAQNRSADPENAKKKSAELRERFDKLVFMIPTQIEKVIDKYYT